MISARQKTVMKGREVPELSIDPKLPSVKTVIKRSLNYKESTGGENLVAIRNSEAEEKIKISF